MTDTRLSDEHLLSIHDRLCRGDPIASSEMAEAVFHELTQRLERFSQATPEEAADAVSRTLMDYFKNPSAYDRTKSKLRTYLNNAGVRDFINERQKARRLARREKSVEDVEDYEGGRNKLVATGGHPDTNRPDWLLEVNEAWTIAEQEFPDPCDREMVQLMLSGERSYEEYARTLGIEGLPLVQMRREVKRHKDRIQKRLQRLRERHTDET